ncbi:MAG TPA: ankyrin repeat domain-containing protein [Gemmataceae bacterium]|nr:ankyrin repeat domain-containing protein [Gemmataceae bacterium]
MSTVTNNKFFQACSTGKSGVVAAYLDSGVGPNARDQYQLTGLIWAGRKGRIEVANLLLQRGADIDAEDLTGRTALFHAVAYKRHEFVEFLAKRGANASPIDMHDWTPLDCATSGRDKKMVALLERLGAVRKSTEAERIAGSRTEISIGQQSGGPADPFMWPKIHLYMMFEKHCTANYCPTVDKFALVLRVGGSIDDFGPEAIERIRRRRPDRYITVDIVVPVERWKGKREGAIKKYLAEKVRSALESCVARLKKDKEALDDEALLTAVDTAIEEFLTTPTPHKPWD